MWISDVTADQYIWLPYLSVSATPCVHFAYLTFFVSRSYNAPAQKKKETHTLSKSFVPATLATLH